MGLLEIYSNWIHPMGISGWNREATLNGGVASGSPNLLIHREREKVLISVVICVLMDCVRIVYEENNTN